MHEVKRNYPDHVYLMMGLRNSCGSQPRRSCTIKTTRCIRLLLWANPMDLYWDKTFQSQQQDVAVKSIGHWADLPIVIHCRDALTHFLGIGRVNDRLRGVFHCFWGLMKMPNVH